MITVLINVVFIPVYGYMASAWAHVASYGTMIILSFVFAQRHYKVNYNMIQFLPYFLIAVGMVLFGKYFNYPGLITELIINSIFLVLFIAYAQYKDNVLSVFFKRSEK